MLDIKSDDDMHSSIDRASTHRRCDTEWGSSSGSLPDRTQGHQNVPSSIRNAAGDFGFLTLIQCLARPEL
jgi:hypothetical protein